MCSDKWEYIIFAGKSEILHIGRGSKQTFLPFLITDFIHWYMVPQFDYAPWSGQNILKKKIMKIYIGANEKQNKKCATKH